MMVDTPRANAKPRDTIHPNPYIPSAHFKTFAGSPPQGESTRIIEQCFNNIQSAERLDIGSPTYCAPGGNLSEMVGSSPHLNLSNKRGKSKKSFTEIESPKSSGKTAKNDISSSKKSTPIRTPKQSASDSRRSSQADDDDQPSGYVRYTGEGTNKSMSNNSRSFTSPKSQSNVASKLNFTNQEEGESSHTGLIFLGVAAVLMGVGAVSMGVSNKMFTPDWKVIRKEFRSNVDNLKDPFSSQTKSTFKIISSALLHGLQKDAEHPGALILMYPPEGKETAICLMSKLADILHTSFQQSSLADTNGLISGNELFINATTIRNKKSYLQNELTSRLSAQRVVGILDVDNLHANTAHVLQGILDNSGAPYKNAAVLMSMESSKAAEATQAGGSCNLDEVAENILREKWRAIGEDKIDALVSRVTVSVVAVQPEPKVNNICQ